MAAPATSAIRMYIESFRSLAGRPIKIHRIHMGVNGNINGADHHFLPTLVPPSDFLRWVGVRRIVGRIVESRQTFDTRAARQLQRLGEIVLELPGEVVARNAKQHL